MTFLSVLDGGLAHSYRKVTTTIHQDHHYMNI
jgi:hypothetical protein